MPAAQNSTQFLQCVRKSGLVEAEALAQALGSEAEFLDTEEITALLITKQLLTPFQTKMLRTGVHKGLIVGPYKILEQIGRGGMGIVYLAEHQKLKRQVALKVLPKDKTKDRIALERFYREARAVAALDHANIVKAHDVNEHDGVHYFVMEYVKGANLQQYLDQKGPLPWKLAVNYITQACWGLQHAHKKGMVHRDIKPGNLLVDRKGTLKILDLGLARCFANEKDNVTGELGDSAILGSVDYIAPEQALASDTVDIRTDLYSLGVTFFTLVVGKPPFEGSVALKLAQHQVKPPPLMHDRCPEVPPELSAVVARMMAKKQEDRYATPADVVTALAPWMGGAVARKRGDTAEIDAQAPTKGPSSGNLKTPSTGEIRGVSTDQDIYAAWTSDTRAGGVAGRVTEEVVDPEVEERRRRRHKKKAAEQRRRKMLWTAGIGGMAVPLVVLLLVSLFGSFGKSNVQLASAESRPPAAALPAYNPPSPKGPVAPPLPSPKEPAPKDPPRPQDSAPPKSPNPRDSASAKQPDPKDPTSYNLPGMNSRPPADEHAPSQGIVAGQHTLEIEGNDLNGEYAALSNYRGKVVLLHFWTFSSGDAVRLIPFERSLVFRLKGKPFTLLGVNNDKNKDKLMQDLATHEVNWRSFKDEKGRNRLISKSWGITTWPTLFLIDHKGTIRQKWAGRVDEAAVEKLIGEVLVEAERDHK
jgi:serine/threonine protein kinase